jgi:glycolate oxidase iron-sulfur subunit
MDAWQRDVHRSALSVMHATGASVAVPGAGGACCGALHVHAGRTEEARLLARRVIAAMPGDAPVVVDSAGCGAVMKDYGRLLGTTEAGQFAARVRDFSEWVVGTGTPAMASVGTTVVVQDPCHLRHVQHASDDVRVLLRDTYDLAETADDGLCCGAGGAYAVLQPSLAGEIRDRKVVALQAAGGDSPLLVVSANPGCAMHLAAAGVDVRHPAQLVEAALTGTRAPNGRATADG